MSIELYNNLPEQEQWELFWDKGLYLGDNLQGQDGCMTYALFEFFVNLFFDENGKVERIVPFNP